jgi:hypothetical protein
MSLTNKERVKIKKTNEAFLNEYKKGVIFGIKKYLEQENVSFENYIKLKTYIEVLEVEGCSYTTADFIDNQIRKI